MATTFLIVANARTGSTWLETLVGNLPDIYTDYEFKWKPEGYDPKPVHYLIPEETTNCREALLGIDSNHPLRGSKLIFDPRNHSREEYESIQASLDQSVKIIHLTRKYEEIITSWLRPTGKMSVAGEAAAAGSKLQDTIEADNSASDFVGSYCGAVENYCDNTAEKRAFKSLLQALGVLSDQKISGLARTPAKSVEKILRALRAPVYWSPRKIISILSAYFQGGFWLPKCVYRRRMEILLQHDLWISSLATSHDYLRLNYEELPEVLPEVAEFLGSEATSNEINESINNPATEKVIKNEPEELLSNFDEVHELSEKFRDYLNLFQNRSSEQA